MRFFRPVLFSAAAASLMLATPAVAHDGAGYDRAAYEGARADWLAVCRHDQRRGHNGLGGGLIGGLIGGLLGNRIAGRDDRVLGTVVGGVAGAAAGVAIDKSQDRVSDHDYCEAYLNAYSQPAYPQQMVMVPVMMAPMAVQAPQTRQEPCTETIVTEEWVTEPARPHTIIHRVPPTPDKRVRIAPDKRIRN
jgi:hypothetical protein